MIVTVEDLYNQQAKIEEQLGSALVKTKDWFIRFELLKSIQACSQARAALVQLGTGGIDRLEY